MSAQRAKSWQTCLPVLYTMEGFHCLLQKTRNCTKLQNKFKVELEATGYYSYNLLGFLIDNGLPTYVLNPLAYILFPEPKKMVPSLHRASVYALLEEFPGAKQIVEAHLTRSKSLLEVAS